MSATSTLTISVEAVDWPSREWIYNPPTDPSDENHYGVRISDGENIIFVSGTPAQLRGFGQYLVELADHVEAMAGVGL